MALTISTWLWGDKYGREYLDRLIAGVGRHLKLPYRFLVISDVPIDCKDKATNVLMREEDRHLLEQPGCLVRLRMFDPEWQREVGLVEGDQLVCIDLDVVIVRSLDKLFQRPDSFCILGGANASNPCPFNGSLMMLRIGSHAEVWRDFSLDALRKVKHYEYPDDQEWIWSKIPDAGVWKCGSPSGVYAFRKPGWPVNDHLPVDACILAFPGKRDPSQFAHLPFVRMHWI